MGTNGPRDPKAADVASSILRELGVNGSEKDGVEKPDLELAKNTEADPSTEKDLSTNLAQDDLESGKQDSLQGFRRVSLQVGYAALAGITGFIILLIAGGYLNLIDRSLFQQLLENRYHQIEFDENLRSRLVKNHLNREPLVVLEGGLRNLFNTNDLVSHVRLKALAFDQDNLLLESRTSFAGILLSDEELKRLSRSEIQRLFEQKEGREIPNENLFWNQELPFQTVFFNTGKRINHTSVQIVSYHRNGELVYVRSPNSES